MNDDDERDDDDDDDAIIQVCPPPLPLFLETDVAGQLRLSIPLGACVCLSRFCANDARFELSGN